ncbi:MAG: lamin tail domain-containing protein, partial [Verrucomicrobiaceae bacterium]
VVPAKGRDQSDGENWRASTQRSGSPGAPDPDAVEPSRVLVNEILTRTASGVQQVELFNAGSSPADVSGWFLTNDLSVPGKFRLPAGTVLPPGGYAVFTTEHFAGSPGPDGALSFAATGDSVWLISANSVGLPAGYVHGFSFGAAEEEVSFARWVNSKGDEQFPAAQDSTFGSANTEPLSPAIQVSEIHYRPVAAGVEWVELRNNRRFPIILKGWKLDGLGFTFPDGAEIPARGMALVVQGDPAAFRERYEIAEVVAIFGNAPGTLQDDGEEVALRQPSDLDPQSFVTVERVRYNDKDPWPVWAARDGYSLQRIPAVGYGDDPAAWLAGKPSPGVDTS